MVDILCARAHRLWAPMVERLAALFHEGRQILVIVPEQYTLQAERDLMLSLHVKGFFDLEVLSPSRLQYQVFERLGADPRVLIDERGRGMAVARALNQVKDDLQYYLGAHERLGFIRRMADLLSDFKGIELGPEDLLRAAERLPEGNLKRKLQDSATVLNAYEGLLAGQYADQQDIQLDILRRMDRGGFFRGKQVFVYGFDVLTEALHRILLLAASQAEGLCLTLVADRSNAPDGDAFDPVMDSLRRFEEALERGGILSRVHWLTDVPLDAPPEIRHLEKHLMDIHQSPFKGPNGAIQRYAAPNPWQEVQHTARQLLLALKEGLDPKDALVLCGDLPVYRGLIAASFEEWGIPCFVADKLPLAHQPLCRYLLAALRCVADGWRDEDMKALIASGFTDLTEEEGWLIQNYALAYGIRGGRWRKTFTRGEEALRAQADEIRQRLTAPLIALHQALVDAKNAAASLQALEAFLLMSRAEEKAQQLEQDLENGGLFKEAIQSRQVWPLLQEMLEQMGALMGEERIPLRHFALWLESGLSEKEIASLPPQGGQVQVGQLGNLLPHRPRQVFLLGLNEGILDAGEDGLLSEEELDAAEEQLEGSLGLRGEAREAMKLLDLWKAMSAPTEKLFLSYALSNEEGGVLQPLPQLNALTALFPGMREEGGALAEEGEKALQPLAPAPALDHLAVLLREGDLPPVWQEAAAFLYQDPAWTEQARAVYGELGAEKLIPNLPEELTGRLFPPRTVSVSRLEDFSGCPFLHFVKEGLKPRERLEWSVEPIDTGNFYHAALEGFTRLALRDARWPQVSDGEARAMMDEALRPLISPWEDLPFHDSARSRKAAEGYIDVCRRMGWLITRGAQNADMRPLRAELTFGEGGELPPIWLLLDKGREIQLRGKIDRLDRFQGDGEDFLRVVDYKSGQSGVDPGQIWGGLQLQLLIYLKAALSAYPGAVPAGAYYQYVSDPIISTEEAAGVEEGIFKKLRLKGFTLDDPHVVSLMDKDEPLTLGITRNKDGSLSRRATGLLTLDEMDLLTDHALRQASNIAGRIQKGEIKRLPFRDSRGKDKCQYCEYGGICRIDKMNRPQYRSIPSMKMKELIDRLNDQRTGRSPGL